MDGYSNLYRRSCIMNKKDNATCIMKEIEKWKYLGVHTSPSFQTCDGIHLNMEGLIEKVKELTPNMFCSMKVMVTKHILETVILRVIKRETPHIASTIKSYNNKIYSD